MIDLFKLTTAIKHQNHSNGNIHLTGLAAVTCILKLLSKRYSKDEIIYEKFDGDVKLVSTWIQFLKEKHWVVEEKNEDDHKVTNLRITKEGKIWLNRFESADIKINN
ncbi:MAG: hypothetical protein WCF06_04055 [Nitrososphaeraceae archaeon]